jgi:hypothetical protein
MVAHPLPNPKGEVTLALPRPEKGLGSPRIGAILPALADGLERENIMRILFGILFVMAIVAACGGSDQSPQALGEDPTPTPESLDEESNSDSESDGESDDESSEDDESSDEDSEPSDSDSDSDSHSCDEEPTPTPPE